LFSAEQAPWLRHNYICTTASTGLGFVFTYQTRRNHPAESGSLSFGLVVHLLLLSTLPHGNAVAFGYRLWHLPEEDSHLSVWLRLQAH